MKGGVTLFRGAGRAARRYLESDRSLADDCYLEGGAGIADFAVVDADGQLVNQWDLSPAEYAAWVDWTDPISEVSMGTPPQAGEGRNGSPLFAKMVVNVPKSPSIVAALHPKVSAAPDDAQSDTVRKIRTWLGQHSVTRIGRRGAQRVVRAERLQTFAVSHRTSRAGDPHRHVHLQIGTRVWAEGAWRALDTPALFRQQGAIRAMGSAILAAHPQLAAVLDRHGLTLDQVTGEVVELVPRNHLMSKRAAQVARNLAMFEREWMAAHPGQEPGADVRARLRARAWDPPAAAQAALRAEHRGRLARRVACRWMCSRPAASTRRRTAGYARRPECAGGCVPCTRSLGGRGIGMVGARRARTSYPVRHVVGMPRRAGRAG